MAKAKAEEKAESAAKARAGREEEASSVFATVPLDDEQIASVRWCDTLEMCLALNVSAAQQFQIIRYFEKAFTVE